MAKARTPVAAKARKTGAAKVTKPAGAARRKPSAARKLARLGRIDVLVIDDWPWRR